MTLPKHLRPRYRYLAATLETWPDAAIDRAAFEAALVAAIRDLFGDAGVAAADARLRTYSLAEGAGTVVVRTRRAAVDTTRAGLAAMGPVEGAPIAVCVRGISGTIRGCEAKYLHGRQLPSAESTVAFEGVDRPAVVRGARVDVDLGDAFVGATDLDLI